MRKILILLSLLLAKPALSQTVIHGDDILDGELKTGYYLLLKIDGKTLADEWKNYLTSYGRVAEVERNRYSITKFKQPLISSNELEIESKISEFDIFTKLFCVVEGVSTRDFNERAFDEFLLDFAQGAQYNELARLAEKDFIEAENYLKDSQRDQKKIERSLENNLKTQEKYGKLLDESPEKMVGLLDEKKSIVEQQIDSDLDEQQALLLSKEAKRKEKEIAKNKNSEAKYAKRLRQKENEFDKLKEELFAAKRTVTTAEELVSAKKMVLADLKK